MLLLAPLLPAMPISVGDSRTYYKGLMATTMDEIMTKVAIVGGGSVGLSTSLLLMDYGKAKHCRFRISVYEKRWTRSPNGKVMWKGAEENNNRRYQVVTIQSNVWSLLPPHVQNALFPRDGQPGSDQFVEMWPYGPDSPQEVGAPRNIPIKVVEDTLLAVVQTAEATRGGHEVTLHPEEIQEKHLEDNSYDYVIFACGSGSVPDTLFAIVQLYADHNSGIHATLS